MFRIVNKSHFLMQTIIYARSQTTVALITPLNLPTITLEPSILLKYFQSNSQLKIHFSIRIATAKIRPTE